jgi:hypothetical protein
VLTESEGQVALFPPVTVLPRGEAERLGLTEKPWLQEGKWPWVFPDLLSRQ